MQVDKDFIPSLMYIRDNEATAEEFEAMTLPFTVPNASGQDIQLSSKYSHITLENRAEYVRLAINYRSENHPMRWNLCFHNSRVFKGSVLCCSGCMSLTSRSPLCARGWLVSFQCPYFHFSLVMNWKLW